jgi:hypothetical protein
MSVNRKVSPFLTAPLTLTVWHDAVLGHVSIVDRDVTGARDYGLRRIAGP